ncbi:MAG: hypothetical protein JRG80_11385 [Deltaproteobacteria bacterium]|nr:hypothetical protein [Deltaproteobacteria bacterium]MBW2399862.1 hypothetical protein [Deltaproteobacteria bacterium]MBW2665687.1 hypothetical protein [Deltaproteobacteria bacterium]
MPLYAFIGNDGPRGAELRKLHRARHLEGIDALVAEDRVLHAGPLLDDAGGPIGSLVLFEAADLEAARKIAAGDPYVTEGIFESWRVHETKVVRGRG